MPHKKYQKKKTSKATLLLTISQQVVSGILEVGYCNYKTCWTETFKE